MRNVDHLAGIAQAADDCVRSRLHGRVRRRRGFTLAETLIATGIVAMLTAALGSLVYAATGAAKHVTAVRQNQHHGRRCSDRLTDLIRTSTSSRLFPGAIAITSTSSAQSFTDVLVLWQPIGAPVAPTGRPRVRELLLIGPSPADPSKLLQYRRTGDVALAPSWNDSVGWAALANSIMTDPNAATEIWTDQLHWKQVGLDKRGNLSFAIRAVPSNLDWQQYVNGTRTWDSLSWGVRGGGSLSAIRVTDVEFEMHLRAPTEQGATLTDFDRGIFFGAGTIRTVLEK